MYKVAIEEYGISRDEYKVLKEFSFEVEKDANAKYRQLIKEYAMIKHGCNYVNYSKGVVIITNY
jgi:hypothetical protein